MNLYLDTTLFTGPEKKSCRAGYGDELLELAKKNKKIVVLDADLAESLKVSEFRRKYPTRFFEMGVAEATMISAAAGLALEGFTPFTSSFAVFTPNQALSQIRVSVAYNRANVKIVASHAGITTGGDGATHQALEDIAIMRTLPGVTVLAPADYWQARKCVRAAAKILGPVYIRFGRSDVPSITTEKTPFQVGRAQVLQEGRDIAIFAHGEAVYRALLAAKELKKHGIRAAVINMHTIKPLDGKIIEVYAKKCKRFIVTEDHQMAGGLGSAIAEYTAQHCPVPISLVAVRDKFGESGDPEKLIKKYHIDTDDIIEAAHKMMDKK
ncbi:MAG: transketolase C-terminal domain-containing protein [Patescibacteria group bacterium]